LLDGVIFNLLIGNHDAHAKNFSLLYMPGQSVHLAPLYDLVSTVFYPELTDRMAMKIGKQPKSALLYPKDIDRFAADAGLGAAQTRARIPTLARRSPAKRKPGGWRAIAGTKRSTPSARPVERRSI
jgi:serine/threonine-protein kinase HipA